MELRPISNIGVPQDVACCNTHHKEPLKRKYKRKKKKGKGSIVNPIPPSP
jgi:hypothetical protein